MKKYKLYIKLTNGFETVYHCYVSSTMAIKTAKALVKEKHVKAAKVVEIETNTIYEEEGR